MSQQKVALVTGANSGIGRWTAKKLAADGYKVFLACRNEEKARPVVGEINAEYPGRGVFLPLDLADLKSVRECARLFLATGLPLPLLVCNAGLAGAHGRTKQGFELTFGVCHVGHFLLTQLLLERIKASAPARVVVVSSKGHLRAPGIDFEAVRERTASRTGFPEYCQAKLANVLFATELARRLQGAGVTTYALHPGVVATDVWRTVPALLQPLIKLFMTSEEDGASTTLYCATDPAVADETGLYYVDRKPSAISRPAQDLALAQRLWSESEKWVAAA